jgi:hypothetical protein
MAFAEFWMASPSQAALPGALPSPAIHGRAFARSEDTLSVFGKASAFTHSWNRCTSWAPRSSLARYS